MTASEIKKLIQQGEGISVEFKSSSTEVSSTTYEIVCAFLNRSGGHVMLGVNDSGKIIGVKEQCIELMIQNFINITLIRTLMQLRDTLLPKLMTDEVKIAIYKKKLYICRINDKKVNDTNCKHRQQL
ncbi:MAG: putative DNA binding domain-containing protein [Prevotellaceae bacterium]|jgi:predicted HTH transcriptional regulator|nr:putative DNA binding domain-containing protein [Prevotellaceae bacterium]